ncbi:MAG TPA: hypothetical protein VF221_12605 [Chloroflexota bacterium]
MSEAMELRIEQAGARPVAVSRTSLWRSPYAVGGVILLVYALWFGAFSIAGYSAHDMILISKMYATQSHVSSAITYDPQHYRYAHNKVGYDGQFFYFIAADPIHARYYLDNPAYRYTKILYPILARLVAFGQVGLIPYTLLLINWLAAGVGTMLVAAWLRRRGLSPWLALAYGLYPGIFIGFQRDLTEPLSYALVALAVYLFDFGGRNRVLISAAIFALAVLTRDKAVVFPALFSAGLFFQGVWASPAADRIRMLVRNVPTSAVFLGIAAGPLVLWKLFLRHWMHSMTLTQEGGDVRPFHALAMQSMMNGNTLIVVLTCVVPGVICGAMAVWALYRRQWDVKVWTLLVIVLFSVVTLDPQFYRDLFGMLRVSSGVVLATLYGLPFIDRATGGKRAWWWTSLVLWFPIPFAFALFGPLYILHGHGS